MIRALIPLVMVAAYFVVFMTGMLPINSTASVLIPIFGFIICIASLFISMKLANEALFGWMILTVFVSILGFNVFFATISYAKDTALFSLFGALVPDTVEQCIPPTVDSVRDIVNEQKEKVDSIDFPEIDWQIPGR